MFERDEASKAAEAAAWVEQRARDARTGSVNEDEHAALKAAFAPEREHFPISKSQKARENILQLVPYDQRNYGPTWKPGRRRNPYSPNPHFVAPAA